jgi:RHS repeat-associated protein
VNGKAKVYFHEDRLGSTEYITDDFGGNVLSYIDYDPWGVPTNKAVVMLGFRAVDLVAEYTGHPYDNVLSAYFAEARMYDAADRRFLAADAIKGNILNPLTLAQYTYVVDNPIRFTDPDGLYYIVTEKGRDGNTYYHAEAQSTPKTIARAFQQTFLGEPGRGKGVWGGNSVDAEFTINAATESLIADQIKDLVEKKYPKIAGLFGVAGKIAEVVVLASNLDNSYGSIQKYDSVIFELFNIANFVNKSKDPYEVKRYMSRAYDFVKTFSDYFFKGAYSDDVDSYFQMHTEIIESENPNKLIQSYYDKYYNTLSRFDMLRVNGIYYPKGTDNFKITVSTVTSAFKDVLESYKTTLEEFADALVDYVTTEPELHFAPRD